MASNRTMAASLALVPFAALGLARFAYGLLLPPMRAEMDWSYAAAGTVTTANSIGYLAGAILAPALIRRQLTDRQLIVGGVVGTAVSLIVTGLTQNYALILVGRFGAGIFGGIAFVAAGALAAHLSANGVRAALVWFPAGAAAAVTLTALGMPPLLGDRDGRWPQGWFLLGAMTLVSAAVLSATLDRGRRAPAQASTGADGGSAKLASLETTYALFGLGYIAYVTFVVAYLKSGGATSTTVTIFWAWIGIAGVASTFGWPRIIARIGSNGALAAAMATCAVGVAVAGFSNSTVASLVSATFFGGSFLAVVSTVTSAARDALAPAHWATAIARLTIAFGAGQILGPIFAGILGDSPAGLRAGLLLSGATLAAGSVVAYAYYRNTPRPGAIPT